MTNKANFVSLLLIAALASAGCAGAEAGAPTPPNFSLEPSDVPGNASSKSTNTDPIDPTPTATPTVTPSTAAEAGTAVLRATHDSGYVADISLTWYEAVDMTPVEAAESCLKNELPTSTDFKALTYKKIDVSVSVEYPAVNGFIWPSGTSIPVEFIHGENNTAQGITCAPDKYRANIFSLELPKPGDTAPMTISKIYYSTKTPNNPNGEFDLNFQNLTFGIDQNFLQACAVSGAENLGNGIQGPSCLVAYPGG